MIIIIITTIALHLPNSRPVPVCGRRARVGLATRGGSACSTFTTVNIMIIIMIIMIMILILILIIIIIIIIIIIMIMIIMIVIPPFHFTPS